MTVEYESCSHCLLRALQAAISLSPHRVTPTVKAIGAGDRRDGAAIRAESGGRRAGAGEGFLCSGSCLDVEGLLSRILSYFEVVLVDMDSDDDFRDE